ncbi:restriction endonuclease subunit S [Paenimyroides aestuarii]|uniref:Restriction endonuclease subunit S n=1 Tax=Paenimyroides aestuarii TaxID=2968490 RepID=A0ABY5NNU8_9FLAO|nr:restriction endonuclease subunit S [Paenimyroides aestuarii]UUV20179.1 restriction endonuclease subunit S [Paenimyroides aestuarii]
MSKNKLIPELRFPEFKNEGEWEYEELGKVSEIVRGGSPRPIQDYLTTSDDGLNWLKIADVPSDSKYITGTKEKVIKEALSSTREVNIGDLILSNSMSFGRPYILKIRTCIHDGWIAIRKISKVTFEDYLYYFISSESSQSYFNSNAAGAAVKNLNADIIKLLPIHFPNNKKEQQKIASCLSSLDEVIAAHNQKLDLLKDHKKGLMQNLFPQEGEKVPKVRFPEFHSPLVKVGFADLGDIKIGLTHKPDYINSGVPFLSSKNISNGYIDFTNVQYISREKFESMPESTKPKLGDILFTRVGSNLGNPIVLEQDIEFGIFVSLGAFRVNKKANNFYMKYWMESDLFWKQVNQKVAGGAKDNLNSTWLREFELFIPSVEEQQKIASCLSSLDALITAQAEKIEQLKQHKKGLMQGLFPKMND